MNRNLFLLRYLVCLFIVLGCMESHAQFIKKRRGNGFASRRPGQGNSFLDTQWWLGLKTGLNLTQAVPEARYAVFSPVNYDATTLNKTYGSYEKTGVQAGIEVTFYHKGFSLSFQPNYRVQRFGYQNKYTWENREIASQQLTLNYTRQVRLRYVDLPLIIKYDILQQTTFRPFIQLGGYYVLLAGADKSVSVSGSDRASGGVNEFEGASLNAGADALFLKSSAGVLGGAGVNYDLWKIRVVCDVVYRYGLQNITNASNRYANNSLSGLGDTMDDISLHNISINLSFLFPLRFISKDFNAID